MIARVLITLKNWHCERETIFVLSQFSDRQLKDIGASRGHLREFVKQSVQDDALPDPE